MSVILVFMTVSISVSINVDHMSVSVEMAMNQGGTSQHVKVISLIPYERYTLIEQSSTLCKSIRAAMLHCLINAHAC